MSSSKSSRESADLAPGSRRQLARLRKAIRELIAKAAAQARQRRSRIRAVLPVHRLSATNLAHYIGLRRCEIRGLQLELASLGLSSLGRCEGNVMDTLCRLDGWLSARPATGRGVPLDGARAEQILHRNSRALFGPKPGARHVYIMATAPDLAEASPAWADAILRAGVDLLRINAAHENPEAWRRIIATFRERAILQRRTVRVLVDMPGPKLRAQVHARPPAVLHVPRRKDRYGRTVQPTRLDLVARYAQGNQLPLPEAWLAALRTGDRIRFLDAGGRARSLTVTARDAAGIHAECSRSLYLCEGLRLTHWRRGRLLRHGTSGAYPAAAAEVRLAIGDTFVLASRPRRTPPADTYLVCPEPQLLQRVRAQERVILDDGRLAAIVERRSSAGLRCRVTHALKASTRLRSGKGIAFPDSALSMAALGKQDLAVLEFALRHADGVEVSFVNTPRDVKRIIDRVSGARRAGFGLVLKLETRHAMHNLPDILFQALRYDPVGLMIARGDLAVETGFERLAELQEELLWFGEACHLPVIWATQVLESLAHAGMPTRAEVTDAAMSMRAECVMLNKGPHVVAAASMLSDIIGKMEHHQYKKRSLYRPLQLALGPPRRAAR